MKGRDDLVRVDVCTLYDNKEGTIFDLVWFGVCGKRAGANRTDEGRIWKRGTRSSPEISPYKR